MQPTGSMTEAEIVSAGGVRSSRQSCNTVRILNEIETSLLECKVCFERFSVERVKGRPKNLPCGHVMCWECLRSLAHPRFQRLECPFCRRLCSPAEASDCLVVAHLTELLGGGRPPCAGYSAGGFGTVGLKLRGAFGGWGRLVNPTGAALFGGRGALVVVHDGRKRVGIFSLQGERLHGFGRKGTLPDDICYPLDVAVTPAGHIIVTDAGDRSVKVFTSAGRNLLTVRETFKLPWGTDADGSNRIFVTDADAGTLSRLVVDFCTNLVTGHHVASSKLCCPREIASSKLTGSVVVVEHLRGWEHRSSTATRLKLFDSQLRLLSQIDTFGFSLVAPVQMNVSAVAFDSEDNVIAADGSRRVVVCLGKLRESPSFIPLINQGLGRPVGLICTAGNMLVVLDSSEQAVKIYKDGRDQL
nr:PREDICTED: E3 ubiquitin-protein ligase NHLRC1 [Lepisosteus oculatus]